MNRSPVRLAAVAACAGALFLTTTGVADAATVSAPVATGFAGPLQIAVQNNGKIYVAQAFAGLLTRVNIDGSQDTLVSSPGNEIAGVALHRGKVSFTTSSGDGATDVFHLLRRWKPNGMVETVADLGAYETNLNPDEDVTYGFTHLPASCAAQLPPEVGPASYTGTVDSHPYAVTVADDGDSFVADAAGNDILRVSPGGHVSTVAVLPPAPLSVTAAIATGQGLPACTVGKTYRFEAVPTDVEIGPDGMLYVTSLPGGPEDPSLGARGRVFKVDPRSGRTWLIGTGFLGATNLAVAPNGRVFVANLFGNQVSMLSHGASVPVADVTQPAALEWAQGKLYVGENALTPPGSVVTITP